MFSFIPVSSYTFYFNIAILILVIIAVWQCHSNSIFKDDVVEINAGWGFIILIMLVLYMGQRPISSAFGDTVNYAHGFNIYANSHKGYIWHWDKEWLFDNIMQWFAKYSDIHSFFTLCSLIYVGSLWLAMRRIFNNYYYIPFLVIMSMFTFWSYGVNGVRNGLGASLFILAMTYINQLPVALIICALAVGMHTSVWIMLGAAILVWIVNNSYYYLGAWLCSVVISLLWGGTIQAYIAALSIFNGDDKFSGYLTGSNMQGEIIQMSMVFRWDFLIYSAMPVAIGYYFIFKRDFKDEYYHWIYNTYLVTNAFWILLIRAAYSNRFAQISWFIMPLVLIYPFMRERFWIDHEKKLGYGLLVFYAFAFYYNLVR